jgi:hypothetical protein
MKLTINHTDLQSIGKTLLLSATLLLARNTPAAAQFRILQPNIFQKENDHLIGDSIIYHPVRINGAGDLLPWYSTNFGESFDHVLKLVWKFWDEMEVDTNGIKYYMNHQVWKAGHDGRGIGGDQVAMALSSWDLYYNYTGDRDLIDNMIYQADYFLAHSLTSPSDKWPNIPYPYNTQVESGKYDGDMKADGPVVQPDKAGSFGFELVRLYKKTGDTKYLDAALNIANTMAAHVTPGDLAHSPWPFKINAKTGEVPDLGSNEFYKEHRKASYTANWTGTMQLFSELIDLKKGNAAAYKKAFGIVLKWMKTYPEKTNDWGPFFEDVYGYSNTQINATTYVMFVMEHPGLYKDWKTTATRIFDWVHKTFNNNDWKKYGVTVTNEQTAYPVPGNSHSARQASMELLYWTLTGDTTLVQNAVRELIWATYAVDNDGKNYYPTNDVWMTDGYGDFVRHYIRAMAVAPQLAPSKADHLLRTSSIIQRISYQPAKLSYTLFDTASNDLLRLTAKPRSVTVNGKPLPEVVNKNGVGWFWKPLDEGGILSIRQKHGNTIVINKND